MCKSAPKLEAAVAEKVRAAAMSPEFQEQAFAEARVRLMDDMPSVREGREQVEYRLSGLDQRFDLWAQQLEAGPVDDGQFRKRNEALLKEKAGLQDRLAELNASEAEAEKIEVSLEGVRSALQGFDRVWEEMTIDEQREMLRGLVEYLGGVEGARGTEADVLPADGDTCDVPEGADEEDRSRSVVANVVRGSGAPAPQPGPGKGAGAQCVLGALRGGRRERPSGSGVKPFASDNMVRKSTSLN